MTQAGVQPPRWACIGWSSVATVSALAASVAANSAAAAAATEPSDAPASAPAVAEADPGGDWNFTALLDGRPIGHHRFKVSGSAAQHTVSSEADFKVTFLGITAYRYHHRDTEHWQGECLSALSATTDDDGHASSVQVKPQAPEALTIQTEHGVESVDGCLMSFAYWNPRIETQTRLLNAQTGKIEQVHFSRAANTTVQVRGQPVHAAHWRLTGAAQPIDLWYSERGEWIGLDSVVAGGRKLSYRLDTD